MCCFSSEQVKHVTTFSLSEFQLNMQSGLSSFAVIQTMFTIS